MLTVADTCPSEISSCHLRLLANVIRVYSGRRLPDLRFPPRKTNGPSSSVCNSPRYTFCPRNLPVSNGLDFWFRPDMDRGPGSTTRCSRSFLWIGALPLADWRFQAS